MVVLFARSQKFFKTTTLLAAFGFAFLATAIATPAHADILFEGYSKVMLSGEHVGYTIVRYEFDPKKQEFVMVSLLHTNSKGGSINESLKARSGSALKPISYQYTSVVGGKGKTIDATFAGDEMTANIREDGKPNVIKKKIPKGAFLSSFLAYLMLQGKEGIKTGTKYGYQAIAEEDATINAGEAIVEKEEMFDGISTFRVLNNFKGARFISNVTAKGEVVSTHSPVEQISTELVATLQDAVGGDSFNSSSVKTLFGSVPKGTENSVARHALTASTATSAGASTGSSTAAGSSSDSSKQKTLNGVPASSNAGKKQGVPQGTGINVKGAPDQGE